MFYTERRALNEQEPRPDQKQPERPTPEAPEPVAPPRLVFTPDGRQAARVLRVRTFALIITAVVMAGALIVILTYRPRPQAGSGLLASLRGGLPYDTAPRIPAPSVPQQPAARHEPSAFEVARLATGAIDTLYNKAVEKWQRATELTPQGVVTRDNGEGVAAKLTRAVILADSARRDIALARQQAELVHRASRDAKSGAAYRLSVLYAAIDRYVKLLSDDAADRSSFYATSEASVRAVLLGDDAESETKQNVAMSYLRKSEDRQRSIQRQAQQVHEALQNLDNADR